MSNAQVIILIRKPEGDGYIEWKATAPLSIFTAKAKKEIEQKLGVTNERI